MKQGFRKLLLLVCIIAGWVNYSHAADPWCSKSLGESPKDVSVTCQKSGDNYVVTITCDLEMTGLGGCYWTLGTDGNNHRIDANDDDQNFNLSADGKTITITTSKKPIDLYTPLYVLIDAKYGYGVELAFGEWKGKANDIDWDANCSTVEDNNLPVITGATLVSEAGTKATFTIAATDKNGDDEDQPIAKVEVVDESKSFDQTFDVTAADNNGATVVVTGLTPSTTYNFTFYAIDKAGNKSTSSQTASVTTSNHLTEPATAAPVPTHDADVNRVKSIYSDKFGTINLSRNMYMTGTYEGQEKAVGEDHYYYYNITTSGGGHSEVHWGNPVLAANSGFRATDSCHIDVWAEEDGQMSLRLKFNNNNEYPYTLNLQGQQWNSFDIALGTADGFKLTETLLASSLDYVQFSTETSNNEVKTFAVDNLYIYREAITGDVVAPTISAVGVDYKATTAKLTITAEDNDGGSGIEYYTVKNGSEVLVASSTQNVIELTGLTAGTTYNLTVTATDGFNNTSDAFAVDQFTTLTSWYSEPQTDAPAITRTGREIKAILTDETDLNPLFTGAWQTKVNLDGGKAYWKYNGTWSNIVWGADKAFTMSNYEKLHFDIWVEDLSQGYKKAIDFRPPQKAYVYTIQESETQQWISVDIDVANLANEDSKPNEMFFSNDGGIGDVDGIRVFYVDNIYLWKESSDATAPEIKSQSLKSATMNSLTFEVMAEDEEESEITYTLYNGETEVATATGASGATVELTATGLETSTAYNFTIKAADEAGNVSEAVSVSGTTTGKMYCSFPTGHLNNANFGDANGRLLLSIYKKAGTTDQISVKIDANNAGTVIDFAEITVDGTAVKHDNIGAQYNNAAGYIYDFTPNDIASFTISVSWHTVGMGSADGRWSMECTVLESELCDNGSEPTGIEEAVAAPAVLDLTAPMYNTVGQRVDASYKGIVIQNGKKFMLQ